MSRKEAETLRRLRAKLISLPRQAASVSSHRSQSLITTPPANPKGERELEQLLDPPLAEDELGRLGAYRVLKVLGRGGMGLVFLAEDTTLKRQVAIKVMQSQVAADAEIVARFEREARATAAVHSDHVVAIFSVEEISTRQGVIPCMSMEYLQGRSLQQRLQRGAMSVDETLRFGAQIATGLVAVHASGLIHRDIKPGNIWLEQIAAAQGTLTRAKLLDFGLAHVRFEKTILTHSGALIGTPAYMSPEQAAGESVDVRSDLFSLGVVLYEMATGQKPFHGASMMATLMARVQQTPTAPSLINDKIPDSLSRLIMQLLEKTPDARPANAQVVVDELKSIRREQRERGTQSKVIPRSILTTTLKTPGATETIVSSRPTSLPRLTNVVSTSSTRWRWLMRLGFLGVLGVLAGIAVRIETPRGTLVIESDDDDVEVRVTKNGATVIDRTKQRELRLTTGEYGIELADKVNGLKLSAETITITRDKAAPIRITRVDSAVRSTTSAASVPKTDSPSTPATESQTSATPKSTREIKITDDDFRHLDLGRVRFNGHEYAFIGGSLSDDEATRKSHRNLRAPVGAWSIEEAQRVCQHLGGHLARIESAEESEFLLGLLRDNVNDCWIDAVYDADSHRWTWSDGTPVTSPSLLAQLGTDPTSRRGGFSQTKGNWKPLDPQSRCGCLCEWDVDSQKGVLYEPIVAGGPRWTTLLSPTVDLLQGIENGTTLDRKSGTYAVQYVPGMNGLKTRKSYLNFELECEIRLPSGFGNSGISFRRRPEVEVDAGMWAAIYDNKEGRHWKWGHPGHPYWTMRRDGWNRFRLRANGSDVRVWINDLRLNTWLQPEETILAGPIQFFYCADGKSTVEFRHIRIRELASELSVPDALARQKALEEVRRVFQAEYDAAQSRTRKTKLAATLQQTALQTQNNRVLQYVMLEEALALAQGSADAKLTLSIIRDLTAKFPVDSWKLHFQALPKLHPGTEGETGNPSLRQAVLEFANQAATAERFDLMVEALNLAETLAPQDRDARQRLVDRDRQRDANERFEQWRQSQLAIEQLHSDPGNARAHLTVGKYLCFLAGRWDEGLAHLANGDDARLRECAALDLTTPTDVEKRIVIAETWLQIADLALSKDQPAILHRTRHWLQLAEPTAQGLLKIRVEKALARLTERSEKKPAP